MGKYIPYLKQTSPANKTLTFQKRWPAKLTTAAKAAGHPQMFHYPTKCPIDGDALEQAQAQKQGLQAFDKQVALLKLVVNTKAAGFWMQGTRTGRRLPNKRRAKAIVENNNTLLEVYDYWKAAHPNQTKKAQADRDRYWDEWSSHVGEDEALSATTINTIHRAFDAWQLDMLGRGLTPSTVERARGSIRSILRWTSKQYRIGWVIELQSLPKHTPASKPVLEPEQQQALLDAVVSHAGKTAAMVALMLAGGVMVSEIARLNPDEVSRTLSATHPYITIGAGDSAVKAEARRRIVPIVWPEPVLEVMRQYLPAAIKRSSTSTDPSITVNNWLRARGLGTTGHGLRHTLAAAATAANINPLSLARIGGWSMAGSALSSVMLSYGRGVDDSDLVATLSDDCRLIWSHLL